MKGISLIAVVTALALTAEAKTYQPDVIYGDDNRVDVYQVERSDIRELADSTAAVISRSYLTTQEALVDIKAKNFGNDFNLCKDEPFYEQPAAANCSAFLVGDDIVATAGHCIKDTTCSQFAFVFSYRMQSSSAAPTQVPASEVYNCKEVISREQMSTGQDYALVRLDRVVQGHRALTLATEPVQVNDEIFVIGNPSGLPTKVAGSAVVREQSRSHFVANLDTYGGNSGSAVFNAKTLEVVGVLVRGEQDFEYNSDRQCSTSKRCESTGCRGEDVTNIRFVAEALKLAQH